MNILFLSLGNINNINDQGIYSNLLREFQQQGHSVYIVTPLEKRLNKSTTYIQEENAHYLKVAIGNITKVGLIEKGISTIQIEGLFLKAIQQYMSDVKFDLVMYSTPPITFEKVIRYIKKKDGAKSYLLLKDIFPQNAVDLQMFKKNSLFYKYFRRKEKRLYANSDIIGCMSQANVDFVLRDNPDVMVSKIEICPNSIEPVEVQKNDTQVAALRKKYAIPHDKTVFIYGGNLGKPQGIDFLIECLEANKHNDSAYFIVAGSGTEFSKLKTFFATAKLQNAQLFEQLPKEDYELLVTSCDVGLIFLDHRFTIPNFPSRLLSYMQASMPVLAATDKQTDIGKIIEENQFGFWCESNNVSDFNKQVVKLCNKELRSTLGKNARSYLEENYTAKHSYQIIMKHFEKGSK